MQKSTENSPPNEVDKFIESFAAKQEESWIAFRRERHCSPEPSGEEAETSRAIADRLRESGLPAEIPERGVGVVADLMLGDANADSPAIALRADIDGLRMADRKDVAHASKRPGLAHACGHDAHTTIILAAAETLSALQKTAIAVPPVRLRFIFQPAEETGEGAIWMVEDGYLDNVTSILGLHLEPALLAGHVGIRYGVFTAAVDEVSITVRGRGGHTARPHRTTDPIHAATMLVSTLYQTLPRSVDVREPSVFTVGKIHGGFAANVIPDEVLVTGTLRTTDPTSRDDLINRLRAVCGHYAEMTGNEIEVEFCHSLGAVINSNPESAALEAASRHVVGDERVTLLDRPSMGGEDFAMYLSSCFGAQMRLGCAASIPWPHLHSPVFDIDEKSIAIGARIMAQAGLLLSYSGR